MARTNTELGQKLERKNGNGNGGTSVKDLVARVDGMLAERADKMGALLKGTGIDPDKFRYEALLQLQKKPELLPLVAKNPGSFLTAVMQCAAEGLSFSRPNEAHLIPYKDVITFQRGYKGIAKLARQSPRIVDLDWSEVCNGDKYFRRKGSEPTVDHQPADDDERGEVLRFYALAWLKSGKIVFDEMTTAEVEEHARRFIKSERGQFAEVKAKGRDAANFEAYGLKTVITRLCYRKLDLGPAISKAIADEIEAEDERAAIDIGVIENPEPSASTDETWAGTAIEDELFTDTDTDEYA